MKTQVVPVELTEEMIEAACAVMLHRIRRRLKDDNDAPGAVNGLKEMWQVLLASAPPSVDAGYDRGLEDALRVERTKNDLLVQRLAGIHALIHADEIVLPDGRRFKFHPPDNLVREAWEGLSAAIRSLKSREE